MCIEESKGEAQHGDSVASFVLCVAYVSLFDLIYGTLWGRNLMFTVFYTIVWVLTCFLNVFSSPRRGFDDFCKIEKQAFLTILMHGLSSPRKMTRNEPGASPIGPEL